MRKRHHTNQSKFQFSLNFSLNGSSSHRALRSHTKGAARSVSKKLAKANQEGQEGISPLANWDKEDHVEMRLADEISENELKGFTFSCIESLASLAQSENQSIEQTLVGLANEKLESFVKLAHESREAKSQFKEYVAWSKQLISSVQPLLSNPSVPAQEVSQLNAQIMQCAERSMCQRYRSETLAKRVDFLVGAVADYVVNTGVEMGFPKLVMNQVGTLVSRALVTLK